MTWNPLRKLQLMQRADLDSTTQNANEMLSKLVAEFDSAENVTKSLYQSSKKLPDHILCMGKFETKLTDELTSVDLFTDNEFMRSVLEDWNSFAHLTNTIGDEYVITTQKALLEPLKRLRQAFSELRSAIRMHDSLQFDVIKQQRKVATYTDKEKTGVNQVKLQESRQALATSQAEFSRRTQLLVNDLSKFLSGSVEMLQPLLEGFIAAEVAWIRACNRAIDGKSSIKQATMEATQSERQKTIEESFKSIGSLSICSDFK